MGRDGHSTPPLVPSQSTPLPEDPSEETEVHFRTFASPAKEEVAVSANSAKASEARMVRVLVESFMTVPPSVLLVSQGPEPR